ncbi:anthranilate synthase component I [Methanocaldococcus fervens]|uniref:Anthranilate synthase component 1 n=1 Tax=Methanocaldococcus fervens (strain DSM 4213 / JCM 15782 / AG86) TaxID=573064 RepID=C7P6Z8_METFA|nr:anthranilate synthase component I [Methanocaldococcus fervens]ACV24330.1 anthranilate synthase component I [Methanocaldococcus fervens AG86]
MIIKRIKMDVSPLDVYEQIRGENTFLLESAEGVPKVARYSILGKAEGKVIFKKNELKVESFTEFGDKAKDLEGKYECPLDALREVRNEYLKYIDISNIQPIPRFKGGLVGYLSYDIIRYWIDLSNIYPKPINDLKFPDAEFFIVKDFISFDLKEKIINLIAESKEKIKEFEEIIRTAKIKKNEKERKNNNVNFNKDSKIKSNMSKEEFIEAVKKAKEYIFAGDIFQVVLSRRIEIDLDNLDKLEIYKKVREINPSPYMYYLDFGERKIIGSSPEILVRTDYINNKKMVITRPIAGTIRRGKTEEEDKELERKLLSDEKERAEHVMLVDLARNDIGKISKFGTVEVTDFMTIEKYSHVQHIVSNVVGELKDNYDSFLAVKATFPAGTLSGAPKVRAMEIIEELEKTWRGPYGGGVGYFGWDDLMDLAITIRTFVIKKNKGYIQVGAGIVADSIPENEWEETERKGMANVKTIESLVRKI